MMDPLSITASVAGLTATCVQTAKALHDLKGKVQNAGLTISAICTETTIISASLSRIQSSMLSDPNGLSDKLSARPDLESTLDNALTGCYVVFDVLQAEIQKFADVGNSGSGDLGFRTKLRYVWNEGNMQDILAQIRGLQTALTLLLQLLSTDTMTELRRMMDNNTTILEQVVERTSRFRTTKASQAPRSIFEMSFATQSIHTGDGNSILSTTLFSFDDQVVNSQVYRRILLRASARDESVGPSQTAVGEQHTTMVNHESDQMVSSSSNTQLLSNSGVTAVSTHTGNQDLQITATKKENSIFPVFSKCLDSYLASLFTDESSEITWMSRWSFNGVELSLDEVSEKEAKRQSAIYRMIAAEIEYLRDLLKFWYFHRHRLLQDFSDTISTQDSSHVNRNMYPISTGHEAFYHLHMKMLYEPLVALQSSEGPWITSIPGILQNWFTNARVVYEEYVENYSEVIKTIRKETYHNLHFAQLLDKDHKFLQEARLPWEFYVTRPLTRVLHLCKSLRKILRQSDQNDPRHEYQKLQQLLADFDALALDCSNALGANLGKVDMTTFRSSLDISTSMPNDTDIVHQVQLTYRTYILLNTVALVLVTRTPAHRSVSIWTKDDSSPVHKWKSLLEFSKSLHFCIDRMPPLRRIGQVLIMIRGRTTDTDAPMKCILLECTRKEADELYDALVYIDGRVLGWNHDLATSERTIGHLQAK